MWIKVADFRPIPNQEYLGFDAETRTITRCLFDDDGGGWIDLKGEAIIDFVYDTRGTEKVEDFEPPVI